MKKNLNKILIIILLISPILDLLCGIFIHWNINIKISLIIRSILLLGITIYSLFKYHNIKQITYLGIVFLFSLIFILNEEKSTFLNISWLFKILFFPVLLSDLLVINKNENITIENKYLIFYLMTYVFLLIVGDAITNFKTYAVAKHGKLGFFYSANEISAIISITMPYLFYYVFNNINIKKIFYIIILFISILLLGTKTPIIIFVLCLLIYLIKYLKEIFKNKKKFYLILFSTIIILLLFVIFILPNTYIYDNIIIHLRYLKIKNIKDIMDPKIIDHFLFGSRFKFLANTHHLFIKQDMISMLFGMGFNPLTKTIEMDIFDIFYHLGIIGFIIVVVPLIFMFKNIKKTNMPNILSLVIIFLVSFFTGHILVAPSVSYLCTIIMLKNMTKNKKNILFAAKDLNVGGIETSLVNLLDNIDYTKYNVDLVLEKKEGIFLKNINKDVNIINYKLSDNKNIILRKFINLLKKIKWLLLNYYQYDYSCCYTTYSYLDNFIARNASFNNSIYIHSDYSKIYKDKDDYYNFFETRKIKLYKKIIFVSNESKESFIKNYPELKNKCYVYNNFVNIEKIRILSNEKTKEKKPDGLLFLVIARLDDSSKKLKRAINLMKNLDNSTLYIIGDGPDKKMYQKEIDKLKLNKKVKLVGQLDNPFPYLKMCDYLLCTSDYEGFPMTFLESIVLSTPIISTIKVSDEYIDLGNNYGYIVSKDINKMTKEVKDVIKNEEQKQELNLLLIQSKRMKELEKMYDGE